MNLASIITLLGGLAFFLFGMSLMGDSLKKVAGGKLETTLGRLTSTPLKGVLLGAFVTAVIQSSSATTVMVVGFVNSGIMQLPQAIAIIMGANIGTTATGWILSLASVGSSGAASLFSTATIFAVVAVIGIVLYMTGKTTAKKNVGVILLALSVLMSGMKTMSAAMEPLQESESFLRILTVLFAMVLHILVDWAFKTYLPNVLVTYAPTILLVILAVTLLMGLMNLVLSVVLTVVNPIFGALYTFFFSNIIGKQLSKAVFTSGVICGVVFLLGYFGCTVICVSAAALSAYIPLAVVLLLLWFLIGWAL